MRALFIYNKEDTKERLLIDRAMQEMSSHIEQIEAVDFNLIRDQFKIRETPALIIIRDDLQGMHLLQEDTENSKLRVTAELLKVLEEEDLNIHQMETHRIDYLIRYENNKAIDSYTLELIEGGLL